MEIKVYKKRGMRLLPNSFKTVGVIVVLTSFTVAVLIKCLWPQFGIDIMPLLLIDLIIIGLFLISISKDKIEDERIMFIRLNAMAFAFGFATIYTLVAPFVPPMFGDLIKDITGQVVIMNMLMMYLIWFWLLKRTGKNEK
ncbi:hypothetical protein BDD43_0418 [Mucilaginibacter gracilis]|uniref:Uncharacterized protein n=1 Tax=Mucilaginibacter gracilis TaxID=423350 RepID=A0A495IVI8_9SPHI|nr:hypothetical protein [Mucilaginibacter gracilis]RKR80321.1 hypothetical protein BDD43_0418 [Mucilaginibacter gracilis]